MKFSEHNENFQCVTDSKLHSLLRVRNIYPEKKLGYYAMFWLIASLIMQQSIGCFDIKLITKKMEKANQWTGFYMISASVMKRLKMSL